MTGVVGKAHADSSGFGSVRDVDWGMVEDVEALFYGVYVYCSAIAV